MFSLNNKNYFKNKTILITGGTGSLGSALINFLYKNNFNFKKIIIFSRDELKQHNMSSNFPADLNIRFILGDVRDKEKVKSLIKGVNFIIHAAALKQVVAAEYNPFEFVQTNILGAQNIIEACLSSEASVESVIALSTDKASSPINLYGATKLCSDKLFISANYIKGKKKTRFSVLRYGNVMGSRGSVFHSFLLQKRMAEMSVTNLKMTRFNITIDEAVRLLIWTLINNRGGEIFVPKLPSLKILDLAKAISSSCKIKIIGMRPGEKIYEEMISEHENNLTLEFKHYYIILPFYLKTLYKYYVKRGGKKVKNDFCYRSDLNKDFLNVSKIKNMITKIK
jgi:UDP-N-acetylglucosamine 4,6-dehydratase